MQSNLAWSDFSDIPFRGSNVPLIKEDGPEREQPIEVNDGYARVFDMSNEGDLAEYNRIIDLVAKGIYILCKEVEHWDDKTSNFKIYARWIERFMELPGAYKSKFGEVNGKATYKH